MSILQQAEFELALANIGSEDSEVMLEILRKFFAQWDSGGAVSVMAPVLGRLLAGLPIAPLTGYAGEWVEQEPGTFQNTRCGSVFRERDANGNWISYDIDGMPNPNAVASGTARHRWAAYEITFPYMPPDRDPPSPVMVVGGP